MGKYRSKMLIIAGFMQNLGLKSTRQQNQVILIRMQTKNYVSSLIALKLIMYQNILLTEQSKKQKVQEMKHTLNCAMKDLDQAAQW